MIILAGLGASAQYGNEWINFNQDYWKLQVAEDGLYRVTADELTAQGFPIDQVSADRIKLFHNGEEVAIQVSSTNSRLDYLEFYGQRNDGTREAELYVTPEAQPHQYYSLFSDSTMYFLTYDVSGESGQRMSFSTDNNNTGLAADAYHLADTMHLQTSRYATGLQHGEQLLSQWDEGEGWTGPDIGRGGSADFDFNLRDTVSAGPPPTLEVVILGRNSLAHIVDVSVGPDAASLRSVALTDRDFSRRTSLTLNIELEWSDIGASGEMVVRTTALGLSGAQDRIAISAVRLRYARSFIFDGEQKHFALDTAEGGRSYLRVEAAEPSSLRFYDITDRENPIRLITNPLSDRVDVVVNGTSVSRELLAVNTVMSVPSITSYNFNEIDLSTADYIILTHPDLQQPDSLGNADPVLDYAAYRESADGGNHDVEITNIQDVYDQFGYGQPTPLAIRRMLQLGYNEGNVQWLFMIGRGTTVSTDFYRDGNGEHYLPTFGNPGSDILFGVLDPGSLAPQVAVGRLTATDPNQVRAYLDKVVEHELVPYDGLWRKNIIQLSGGQNAFELTRFRQYVGGFGEIAERDFMGARTSNLSKETTANVEFLNIREEINKGVGMITFFGHSGPAITDIEVDPADRFENKGRYPAIFLVNGCNAGEIFASNKSFGEDWVLLRDKGATNFIAHTDLALSTSLNRYSRLFYEVAYADSTTYGLTLGEITVEAGRRYFESFVDKSAQAQVYPMLLQGDPANLAFAAPDPDYEINAGSVTASSIAGSQILATQDSFKVELIVRNFGRTRLQPLEVAINQTLPDGRIINLRETFERVLYADTLTIFVPIDVTDNVAGSHLLDIQLDPDNNIPEINETNNQVTLDIYISSGNTVQLFPIDQGIVSESSTELIWQPFGGTVTDRSYQLEVDTTSSYDSPFWTNQTQSGTGLLSSSLDLSALPDSSTIFWRTRFAEPSEEEDTIWTESTFTYLPEDTTGGWGQFHIEQRLSSTLDGISYNASTGTWEFQETSNDIILEIFGPDNTELVYEDIRVLVNNVDLITTANPSDPACRTNTFNAIAFDRQTSNPYFPITFDQSPNRNPLICGRTPQLIHNFVESDMLDEQRWMEQLIDNMAEGDQLLLFTIGENTYSNWDAQLLNKFSEVGINSSIIEGLTDGQPVIFFGKKGTSPGTATSITMNATGFPVREQLLTFAGEATGRYTSGRLITQPIGPATDWWRFDYSLDEDPTDNVTINVYGINTSGQEVIQFTQGRSEEIDISTIDAGEYPSLRLEAIFNDESGLTPPQFNYWRMYYETPPDGMVVIPEETQMLLLQEGDSLEADISFYNYSNTDFVDTVTMTATFRELESGTEFQVTQNIMGPASGDTITFAVEEGTVGRLGEFDLRVRMNPVEPEIYQVNNALNLSSYARVEPDRVNPILDVTFDGAYILNGDLVSPRPLINILLKDQNTVLTKEDTTGISVYLRTGDDGSFERIPFTSAQINYTPATDGEDFTIQYEPGPLEDNRYALRVEATDASGNASGSQPYEITFEVVNESSITRFFPYPNPFSTSTRFVFTLTGAEVPDEIKIQIMTVSGRVVREILQDEIGPIRIGNNITQYAWDGRDEYGDQLANGVYFYRVITKINGEEVKNRGTAADQAFKNGYGKLYLLR